jgi:F-type H+-transporting ATPase subunit b
VKLLGWKKLFFAVLLAGIVATPLRLVRAQEATPANIAGGASTTSQPEHATEQEQEEDEAAAFKHSAAVKKFGSVFGLTTDQAATAFEVANFAVLAILIGLFLVKSLPKVFRGRNERIQQDLVDARKATEEANSRMGAVEARLSKLDDEIAAMRAQADRDSALDEQRIKASVEEEKQKILAAAEQEISAAATHAQRQIQKFAAELAIEQAARRLVITAETDRLLIQNFARRVGGDDSKEGQN